MEMVKIGKVQRVWSRGDRTPLFMPVSLIPIGDDAKEQLLAGNRLLSSCATGKRINSSQFPIPFILMPKSKRAETLLGLGSFVGKRGICYSLLAFALAQLSLNGSGFLRGHKHVDVCSFDHEAIVAVQGEAVGLNHLLVVFVDFLHCFVDLSLDTALFGAGLGIIKLLVQLNDVLTLGLHDLNIALKFGIGLHAVQRSNAHELLLGLGCGYAWCIGLGNRGGDSHDGAGDSEYECAIFHMIVLLKQTIWLRLRVV